jgi:predicted secreted Zn-dependent protease
LEWAALIETASTDFHRECGALRAVVGRLASQCPAAFRKTGAYLHALHGLKTSARMIVESNSRMERIKSMGGD